MEDKIYDTSVDFLKIRAKFLRSGVELTPDFITTEHQDVMTRGQDFYAVWLPDKNTWSTSEHDVVNLVDKELLKCFKEHNHEWGYNVSIKYMKYSSSGSINLWHKYVKDQLRDSYRTLNQTLVFSNTEASRDLYSTKRLEYPIAEGSIDAYDKLISTLYDPAERLKIEWAIGAVVSGEADKHHKFLVLYGAHGAGKSTILKIIEKLFAGYYTTFSSKILGNANSSFPLEAFSSDPLVGIDHEGDLSKIETNTLINRLTAHEEVLVNVKYKSAYPAAFKVFLFIATNNTVKITDAKSGIIRRLIDVYPSGRKIPLREYKKITEAINFELGAIAYHCREVYLKNKHAFEDYVPTKMIGETNDFYNFAFDCFDDLNQQEGITMDAAWQLYQKYCDNANVPYPFSYRVFKSEIKNYFKEYYDRYTLSDKTRVRSYLKGFDMSKFEYHAETPIEEPEPVDEFMNFIEQPSNLDILCAKDPAQYAKAVDESPRRSWNDIHTTLSDLDTSQLHYLKPSDTHHIFIDFDLKDENGSKSFERNKEAASKFQPTYAELSKGGAGIHLHYIYKGDPAMLQHQYSEHIEIKTCLGGSSIRRRLSKCNNLPIAVISGGLPVKGEQVVSQSTIEGERHLQAVIEKALHKKVHPDTRSNIDFIASMLDKAYDSGMHYDLRRMYDVVTKFAAKSTHQSSYCLKKVLSMKFCSADALEPPNDSPSDDISEEDLYAFDCEVFQNLFVVCWGPMNSDQIYSIVNPTPDDIKRICKLRLVGFNNRKYDNHILYARMLGYDNMSLYKLSTSIIGKRGGTSSELFKNAYNLSETDIYDFSSEKKSLKKWEIALKIAHKECPIPWDQPVPEDMWETVVDYCKNDVAATKALFHHKDRQADFMARKIQVALVKSLHGINNVCVNDTTNSLSAKIVFGKEQHPQREFNYRDLSKPVSWTEYPRYRKLFGEDYVFHIFDQNGLPTYDIYDGENSMTVLPDGWSILPFFPGYEYKNGVSTYMGCTIGEGGRVYSRPGMYGHVWDGDVTSMHPHSAIAEVSFGPKYTKVLKDLVDARVAIKERRFEDAAKMLGGVLKPYLNDQYAKGLAQALKIIINSIYGLTSAKFDNKFRDPRNVDNIIAKRGALFMTLLMSEVEKRGFTVAHIKTDSIKIPNPTKEIMDFVINFGHEYGYHFTTEYEFDRYCLVNDAVYIARVKDGAEKGKWVAVGDQFKVPYVYKSLFSHENIEFDDICETFNVNSALYLDMNESLEDTTLYEKELDKLIKKELNPDRQEELKQLIEKNHDYQFIGKIGLFCPIKSGYGGGVLLRRNENKDSYDSAGGAKGYRWLESDTVKSSYKEVVDYGYYNSLVDKAVEAISEYGDFEWFISDSSESMPVDFPPDDETPF